MRLSISATISIKRVISCSAKRLIGREPGLPCTQALKAMA
jgi:hypothetical protein